jgi:hypothetical protein
MRRNATFLLLFLSLLAVIAPAGATKYSGAFMERGVDARSLGMGGAFAAIADDLGALQHNPAGLATMSGSRLGFMHDERFSGFVQVDHFAYFREVEFKGRQGGLAFDVLRVGVNDILFTEDHPYNDLNENGEFDGIEELPDAFDPDYFRTESDQEWLVRAFYARRLGNWSLAGGVKVVYQAVGDYSSFGFGLDAGIMAPPLPGNLRFGMRVADLTGTFIAWSTGVQEIVTPSLHPGLAWRQEITPLGAVILLAADLEIRFDGLEEAAVWSSGKMSVDPHLGLELLLANAVALRAGRDWEDWTLGGGLRLARYNRGLWGLPISDLSLDYAFSNNEDWKGSHRVGLGLGF